MNASGEQRTGRRGRREDARFLTGSGTYLPNLVTRRPLQCVFARSTVAHGRIETVDVAGAASQPGVVAAFTATDLDLADIPGRGGRGPDAPAMTRPPLARNRVRYAGEPVAVVVAEDRYTAADALDFVDVSVEPDAVVADLDAAVRDEVLLFPEAGSNLISDTVVGERGPLGDHEVRITVEVENQRLAPAPIETLGILAESPDGGSLTVWCGHQAPHRLRNQLATHLGLPRERIRVIVPDVGGAFGMKGMLFGEYLVVAALALRLQRAVHWTETRYEEFLGGTHGRGQRHRVTLAGTRDGRITAARIDITAEVGAYPHNGAQVPWFSRYMATGAYDIPDAGIRTRVYVTNRAPTGSYRGAGRPEAAYAIERAVDAFAVEAGLDPAEVRRRNFVPADAFPYTTATGARYDSGDYAAALTRALELVDIDERRAEQWRRREAGENPIGIGIGTFVERAGGSAESTEYARVELAPDGRLIARIGTSASGQGHETVWSGLVSDVFEVAPETVDVIAGDTAEVAEGTGSFGSRSAQVGGSALRRTAERVRAAARATAAELLEIAPADLRLSDGRFVAVDDPSAVVTLAEVAQQAEASEGALADEEVYTPGAQTFPYGAYVAVVEVDLDTGFVHLRELVAVDDCGTVLNEQIVEGQVHGSTAQGIAQALYEAIEYGDDGQPRTTSFIDYLAPGAPDLPAYTTGRLVSPAPSNPLGAKGAGESGCIGAPPAIVNAALDALRPYGVTDLAMPLTPERVWRALQAAATDRP